jgi:scyllo-inositol 2-dehydrogenase (NAD+)
VSDVNLAAATALAAELGLSKKYARYQDLIADEEVRGVVIVSPTSTHKEIVIEAAQCGKPIFCEKPLSISLPEAREMLRVIEETGVFFQMGFMRRFDKGYVAAKRKIEEGLIGKPVVFKSSSRDPYRPSLEYLNPAHSGGLFVDCGIHDLDNTATEFREQCSAKQTARRNVRRRCGRSAGKCGGYVVFQGEPAYENTGRRVLLRCSLHQHK